MKEKEHSHVAITVLEPNGYVMVHKIAAMGVTKRTVVSLMLVFTTTIFEINQIINGIPHVRA